MGFVLKFLHMHSPKILVFLILQIREKLVKNDWVNFPLERCGKLDAKKAIFEMEKEFKSNLDSKKKQVIIMSLKPEVGDKLGLLRQVLLPL